MHLGVGQHQFAVPVDQRHRVARPSRPAFQVGEGDGHAQLLRQALKVRDRGIVSADRLRVPAPDLLRELLVGMPLGLAPQVLASPEFVVVTPGALDEMMVAHVPQFGKQRDIRAQRCRPATGSFSFGQQVFFAGPTVGHLQ